MSPDRVIYSFVLGWVVLLAVLIALDWMGNPNRGTFRPKGERPPRDRAARKAERKRRRLEEDASVRAALRDAYGASSLRLTWTTEHESKARELDDALIVDERADAVDVGSREVVTVDRTLVVGDPLPNVAERSRGWKVGGDPLSLTAKGDEPAAGTVRTRVWKNHGASGAWSEENRARLDAGKPPRRVNPITGRHEQAVVDVETGRASWGNEPTDPFGDPS
jgi:hypothetical protein